MSSFVIPIRVGSEEELYAWFDPSGLSFSGELTAYLEDYVEDRRPGESVCLELVTDEKMNKERFRKAYLGFVDKLRRRNRREITNSRLSAFRLLLIGVVFIVIGIAFASKMGEVIAAIISTIGSFSVWEASAVWIETLPVLRRKDRLLNMFENAEFRFTGEDQ